MPPLDDASIELGAVYSSSAVRSEQAPAGEVDDPRLRSWTVGARVPHIPVSVGGGQGSTLDLSRSGFALLVTEQPEDWQRAVDDVERDRSIPIAVHHLLAGALDTGQEPGRSESAAGFGSAALVRPDGVVAWKTTASADQAAQRLPGVLSEVLSAPGARG
jgi:putative polyketide hydroxylase